MRQLPRHPDVYKRQVRDLVRAAGVDYIQGVFYAKPMPEDELAAMLAAFKEA